MPRYVDADALIENIKRVYCTDCNNYNEVRCRACGTDDAMAMIEDAPTTDVEPRAEVMREIFEEIEKIFEKFKMRQCSNSVCAWCIHATDYGRRNEECDKPYIDKNGKEQKACYVYAKFESIIDKELTELKKKYTEEEK